MILHQVEWYGRGREQQVERAQSGTFSWDHLPLANLEAGGKWTSIAGLTYSANIDTCASGQAM